MDFDRENQWWNPSSSSVDHQAQLAAEANEKSSIASTHRRRDGGKIRHRRLSKLRDPNKKSMRSSAGNPEMAVVVEAGGAAATKLHGKAPPLDLSAPHVWAESNVGSDEIQNAARYFSCSSSCGGINMHGFPVEKPHEEKVSNDWTMGLWGDNVGCDEGNVGFVDEEAVFNMPALVNSMAEGMLLTPPAMKSGFKWEHLDDHEDYIYLDLWDNS